MMRFGTSTGGNRETGRTLSRSAMHRLLGSMQRHVINPIVRLAWNLNLPIPGDALLETTGRRTGQRRYTPVCDGSEGDVFWLVAQRGRQADWVRNIEADPRVRIKAGGGPRARWRGGRAQILDGDDPRERQQIIMGANAARRLCICTSRAVDTSPLTVRIDLDPL